MITLGTRVKDSVSGFAGIATARTEYMNGCVQICIEPIELDNGKLIGSEWFDERRVDVESAAEAGGPCGDPPARSDTPPR